MASGAVRIPSEMSGIKPVERLVDDPVIDGANCVEGDANVGYGDAEARGGNRTSGVA